MANKLRREFLKATGLILGGLIVAPAATFARNGNGKNRNQNSGTTTDLGPNTAGSSPNTPGNIGGLGTTSPIELERGYWAGYYHGGNSFYGLGYYQGMYY